MCDVQPLTAFFLGFTILCIGAWIGGWWGWRNGSKWGEANGVRWSNEQIAKANEEMRRR